ncbi:MAG: glycine cleavage system aminomethyltransferase GcvT [Pseudomonadota bacterium]
MRTALYNQHIALGGKVVDFHGWDLPLNYGSQIDEHHAVRKSVGIFDVSHMTVVDLRGAQVIPYLRKILANDVAKLVPNQAMYSCMLNESGGVIDDLIAYKIDDQYFRLVVNSATHDKDLAWLEKWAKEFDVSVTEIVDKCIIAVQGPQALTLVSAIFEIVNTLKPFRFVDQDDYFIARTGYTGEQGVEIIAPIAESQLLWQKLIDAGVQPCGLGARDTLRLEAGLNLYGNDMDETTSPLTSNLGWTTVFDGERNFIGKQALETERANGVQSVLVGLILKDKGVLRTGQKVVLDNGREGVITSGGFSPTLEKGIALARVPLPLTSASVDIRGTLKSVQMVKPNFVRSGKSVVEMI